MLSNFTIEDSFYYIEQHHLDTFKEMMTKFSKYNYILKDGSLTVKDSWIIAFHIWLLLLPNNNIVENVRVAMYYRSLHIIKNELLKNSYFIDLKNSKNASEELLYITALLITNFLNEWTYNILKAHSFQVLREKNKSLLDIKKVIDVKSFFEEEAKIIKILVKEFKNSKQFHELIKKNCVNAQIIYENNID